MSTTNTPNTNTIKAPAHASNKSAATLNAPHVNVLTIEFKLNLLRPAQGERLVCRAEVLKPGRTITVVESTVEAVAGDKRTLVSKATATIANMVSQ